MYILSELINGWYCVNDYGALTQDEKRHNAQLAMSYLRRNGFTIYAASGIVGNMWAESQMSPGQWQNNTPYSGGYGLVQWTPYTNYSEWAGPGWENNGDKQMERLIYERDNNLEFWHNSTTYPGWSWIRFETLEPSQTEPWQDVVNLAAEVFVYRYLAPGDPTATLANRQYHARWVYQNAPGTVLDKWLLLYWSRRNRKRSWII